MVIAAANGGTRYIRALYNAGADLHMPDSVCGCARGVAGSRMGAPVAAGSNSYGHRRAHGPQRHRATASPTGCQCAPARGGQGERPLSSQSPLADPSHAFVWQEGTSALSLAAMMGHTATIKLLVQLGADVCSIEGVRACVDGAERPLCGRDPCAALDHGVLSRAEGRILPVVLRGALRHGGLGRGPAPPGCPCAPDIQGAPPPARPPARPSVSLALSSCAQRVPWQDGWTVVHAAAMTNHLDAADLVLRLGANVNQRNNVLPVRGCAVRRELCQPESPANQREPCTAAHVRRHPCSCDSRGARLHADGEAAPPTQGRRQPERRGVARRSRSAASMRA
jgi:hypothetical protein